MKRFIRLLARMFDVKLPLEGIVSGPVVIDGDVEVQGGLLVTGGIRVGTYISAKDDASVMWGQKFDGTASIPTKKVSTKKSKKYGK